jgi:TolB protein
MFIKYLKILVSLVSVLCTPLALSLDLELTQGINVALPLGIQSFGADSAGQKITEVIHHDFDFSGQFRVIPSIQNGFSGQEAMLLWRQAGADSVLQGRVNSIGGDRYKVEFQLLDVASRGRVLLSEDYQISSSELRSLAHHISDEVYRKLTGERGIFSTQIAYILVNRKAEKTQYYLEVADVDGYNPQRLLTSSEPIMSPMWAPDGRKIAYVSFEKKRAQIYTVAVETGQRRLLTDFTGINGAPAWSPDGRHLAVVLSKSGTAKIYSVDLSNGAMQQLTFGSAIDTEPRYSPDGRSILFTSGRGGSPQIYRLNLADGQITRLTYAGNYNARATYTPNQQNIVMLHREDRQFNIAVQATNSSAITTLTHSYMDESPSVSPNGRLILYATQQQNHGILAMVSVDGRIHLNLPSREGDVQEPAWSPYLG